MDFNCAFFIFDSVASIPCYSASFGKTEVGIVILLVLFSANSERWSTIEVSILGKLLQVCIIVKSWLPWAEQRAWHGSEA